MSKKSRKRNKKILAALALAGGAAMLAKGRGKSAVTGVVNPNAPKTNWITKKAADIVEPVAETITSKVPERGRITVGGKGPMEIVRERQAMPGYGVKAPPGILNPYKPPRGPGRFGNLKGGGIAKRGNGAAYKSGGRTGKQFGGGLNRPVARPIGGVGGVGAPVRPLAYKHGGKVKSMGVAKRGGGIAKR